MQLSVKIPFSGFYETSHSAIFDAWLDYEQETLVKEHQATTKQITELADLFYSEINWSAVYRAYAEKYVEAFEDLMRAESRSYKINEKGERYLADGIQLDIVFEELQSPREYNFSTDCIYAKISKVQLDEVLAFVIDQYEDKWLDYVKDKYTSYDGFISFYSSNFSTWEDDLSEWGEARLGSLLEFYATCILDRDLEDELNAWELMESWSSNGGEADLIWENASLKFQEYVDSLRKD